MQISWPCQPHSPADERNQGKVHTQARQLVEWNIFGASQNNLTRGPTSPAHAPPRDGLTPAQILDDRLVALPHSSGLGQTICSTFDCQGFSSSTNFWRFLETSKICATTCGTVQSPFCSQPCQQTVVANDGRSVLELFLRNQLRHLDAFFACLKLCVRHDSDNFVLDQRNNLRHALLGNHCWTLSKCVPAA